MLPYESELIDIDDAVTPSASGRLLMGRLFLQFVASLCMPHTDLESSI